LIEQIHCLPSNPIYFYANSTNSVQSNVCHFQACYSLPENLSLSLVSLFVSLVHFSYFSSDLMPALSCQFVFSFFHLFPVSAVECIFNWLQISGRAKTKLSPKAKHFNFVFIQALNDIFVPVLHFLKTCLSAT